MMALLRRLNPGHAVPLLVVMLEVLWAYPWLVWMTTWEKLGWSRTPLSLAGAVGLVALAEALTRATLARGWPLARTRVVVLTALLLTLALVVRLEHGGGHALWETDWWRYAQAHMSLAMAGLAFGLYMLWRGISVGREELSFDELYQKFLIGLAALVVLLVAWGATTGRGEFKRVLTASGLYVVAYFSAGLLALAISNLRGLQEEMVRRREASVLLNRRWLTLLVGVVVVIVAASLVFASIFSFDLARLLLHPLNVLAGWLLIAFLYAVGYPLGFLAAGLIYVFRFFASLVGKGPPPQPLTTFDLSGLTDAAQGKEGVTVPPAVILSLKWGLAALVAAAIVAILARTLFRYLKGKVEEGVEEVNESLWSWDTFTADLRAFLSGLLRWLRRRKPTALVSTPPVATIVEEDDSRIFTVREIYQGLLWEGARAGVPRRAPETPYEYQAKLTGRV
ncbi:MAG: hypothetical protein Q8O40_06130, partial [Chloroflexota bacterium]|nr:hypothetical protein [Chloroflexota bacterium]